MIPIVSIPEILHLICSNLNQFDLLNLLIVCKSFYSILKADLYRSITIHSKFTRFDPEYFDYHTTYINSKANIIALLSKPSNVHLIQSFTVLKLPIEFIDFEPLLNHTLIAECRTNFRLRHFICHSPLSISMLKPLSSIPSLSELKFTINIYARSKIPKLHFSSLKSLSVGRYKSFKSLRKVLKSLDDPTSLQKLQISGIPRTVQLDRLTSTSQSAKSFPDLSPFKDLKQFRIEDMVCETPLSLPASKHLRLLSVTNITEISAQSQSIIDKFIDNPPRLKKLRLSIRQAVRDTSCELLMALNPNSLTELDIELNYNSLKQDSLTDLVDRYIVGIRRQASTLRKLSLSVYEEKSLVNIEIPLDETQFRHLFQPFPSLESVRIQTKFSTIYNNRATFFRSMPRLVYLWVAGSTSFEKHWAQGNAYPGIFDSWLRVLPLPTSLVKDSANCHLQYIKINRCLFQVKATELNPRDCIDDWFDLQTRI